MIFDRISKILFVSGCGLVLLSLFWHFFGHTISWNKLPLGRLPGDLFIKRGNSAFYFPVVTCLVISLLVSLILRFLKK